MSEILELQRQLKYSRNLNKKICSERNELLQNMDPVRKGMYLEQLRKEKVSVVKSPLSPAEIAVDEAWEKSRY